MISVSQHTIQYKYFGCKSFYGPVQNSTFPFPKEVVIDFDKALLGAVARTFARSVTYTIIYLHVIVY